MVNMVSKGRGRLLVQCCRFGHGANLRTAAGWAPCPNWMKSLSEYWEKHTVGHTYTASRTNTEAPPWVLAEQISRNCVASPQLRPKETIREHWRECSGLTVTTVTHVLCAIGVAKTKCFHIRETALSADIKSESWTPLKSDKNWN